MTSQEFVIWMKGFTEACHEFHPTPKQWDRLKEVLNEVQDYDDNPGLDVETDDWSGWSTLTVPSSSAISFSKSSGITAHVAWNDKMGCWHYTNSTLENSTPEETKKQLLD